MKNLKIALATLLFVAIATMGTAFKTNAQTTQNYQFTNTFQIGATPSSPISNTNNWSSVTSLPSDCGTGSTYLCGISVVTPQGQSTPSLQTVINDVQTRYDNNGNTLSDGEIIQVFSGSTLLYTITVRLKP
jgi:hypothetical protein